MSEPVKEMPTKFEPSRDMISAARAVFIAMVWVETIRPKVEGYQKEILALRKFKSDPKWVETNLYKDVILDPKDTYLLGDEDLKTYLADCRSASNKAGLKVEAPEQCPLLIAEHSLSESQRVLLETMEPLLKASPNDFLCAGLDSYHKAVDLSLRLLAPYVGDAVEILEKEINFTI